MHTIQWGVASVSGITGRAKVKEQLYARYKSRGGSLALFDFHVTYSPVAPEDLVEYDALARVLAASDSGVWARTAWPSVGESP